MKKTWILTPLLLGAMMWGCNAKPAEVAVDAVPEPPAAETTRPPGVDESLLERPLEEAETAPPAATEEPRQESPTSARSDQALPSIGDRVKPTGERDIQRDSDLAAPADAAQNAAPAAEYGFYEGRNESGAGGYGAGAYGGGIGGGYGAADGETLRRLGRYRYGVSGYGEPGQTPAIPRRDNLALVPGKGQGPGMGGDKFDKIEENDFIAVADQPLSTFSIDVDTASYSKVRSYLTQFQQLPPRDSVRVEELVNYFTYDYQGPTDEHPFAANVEVASCPWNAAHRLVRVGLKGKEIKTEDRPASNLVFLLDVSGSMNSPQKLPLLKQGMKLLVDQLGENDKISIVVYAGAAGIVLEPTYGHEKAIIVAALDRLQAGGSTNGGQGIELAYKTATENFIAGGINRVILCTDGDFNVGTTSTGDLLRLAEEQAKKNIYLSVLGFGIGNHNDAMLEQLSNKANGNYAFIDTEQEAKKVLVEQMSGTLMTIAKDVKIQIEFNPKKVASYRLVGYENRLLAAQDFNDDKKDAGEIGAGHTVTAFYEVVPAHSEEADSEDANTEVAATEEKIDDLTYQTERTTTEAAESDELLTLKLRYKQPEGDTSTLMTYPVRDNGQAFNQASGDFQFASAVAMFGLKLRGSQFHDETNFAEIEELVATNLDGPGASYRQEFLELVRAANAIR